MRRVVVLLLMVLMCTVGLSAQQVDLEEIDPSDIDLSRVDASDAQIFFHGPMELYLSGIRYAGRSYAAVLDYDGRSTVTVKVPEVVPDNPRQVKPVSIDLEDVTGSLTQDGIRLSNVLVNGNRWQGTIVFDASAREFRVASVQMSAARAAANVEQLQQQIASLRQELEDAEAENDNLSEQVSNLEEQLAQAREEQEMTESERVASLRERIQEQNQLIERGRDRIEEQNQLIARGREEIERQNQLIERGRDRIASLEEQLARARQQLEQEGGAVVADLQDQLEEQNELIERGRDRIASLENQLQRARRQLEQEGGQVVADLRQQVEEQNRLIEQGRDQIASLRRQLDEAREEERPARVTAADRLSTVFSGFSRGSAELGSWNRTGGDLVQSDAAQRFAKYLISQRQSSSELLYSVSGRATGQGWRGFGLHFLASGYNMADKYGLGTSYLLWVTRDPQGRQTDQTYVELYKSFNDVRMVLVSSTTIPSSITGENDIQVYVNRGNREISVTVNDELAFTYNDPGLIRSGSALALRALGTARFTGLEMQSR